MKRICLSLLCGAILFGACAPKPQYKTREGKRKLKHYNSIQHQEP